MAFVYHTFVKHLVQWDPIWLQELGANVTYISFLNEIKLIKTFNRHAEQLIYFIFCFTDKKIGQKEC